ncbi:MAG: Maf family nucleotide pyrophosphatase [Dokdonella sp.]|uniref:Maf family protein n=1 Tax=Dokdonella sp. TaxID=2291710 RepID=UPI003267ADF2
MTDSPAVDLVLASTSRYRRKLLGRLTTRFRVVAPAVDETREPEESPLGLAERLARAKARAVSAACPAAWVIGSDQVAEVDGRILGKPGTGTAACEQLRASSGRVVRFHTAVCVIGCHGGHVREQSATDLTHVVFRSLKDDEIARYVARENPLDCAGSFKAEGLGITLFERIESSDPTALIGLPLIAVARLLRAAGMTLP